MIRLIKLGIVFGVFAILVLAIWMVYYAKTPLNLASASQDITIQSNSSLSKIATQLEAQGVIDHPTSFILLARILREAPNLQAGDYSFNKNINPYALILSLKHGKTTQGNITFIEGKTFKQVREKLAKNKAIKTTIKRLSNAQVMTAINDGKDHPEGLFFPDTYYFDRGTTDIILLKQAHKIMQSKLANAWDKRAKGLPYKNSYEALIMASIIEKETGKASERPTISGVFVNRLRIGMRLQTDPTVIYGMGEKFNGNIRRKDLQKDTRYNTYTREGLPPTPIAMPGLASIEAALHPEKTKALYFVGKGDGSHYFSKSLVEHNRAVRKYQLKH